MALEPIVPLRLVHGQVALLHRLSDYIARIFGIRPEDRETLVRSMIDHHHRDRSTYWLHLGLAMGIATIGLALGSTAVVIGAMLISPLMGPIVDLGMALAVGSPFLAIRSFTRVCGSIVGVVGGSALITLCLPFHEPTQEIIARTTPNALDLVVAIFCALAAAFTIARNASDGTTSAAGTAIGISLVPPLCVVGYGLGTGRWGVATGASLLFTANLSAIVLFAMLVFFLLGFGQVPARALEKDTIVGERAQQPIARTARWLDVFFGARYSPLLRLSIPVLFVAAVYFPLRRALTEVSWQVKVRSAVTNLLEHTPEAQNAMRSSLRVENHQVWLQLVMVGGRKHARDLEDRLRIEVARVAGVEPQLQVVAVPDAARIDRTVSLLQKPQPMPIERGPDLGELRTRLRGTLAERWPADAAGPLLIWDLQVAEDAVTLEVWHQGSPLGAPGEALLGQDLTRALGQAVRVRDRVVPGVPARAPLGDGAAWLARLGGFIAPLGALPALRACIELPAEELLEHRTDLAAVLDATWLVLRTWPSERLVVQRGQGWGAALRGDACPTIEPPAPPPPARRKVR
jgi:uncharacterized hydrophobic protein (TIGR00271 family)